MDFGRRMGLFSKQEKRRARFFQLKHGGRFRRRETQGRAETRLSPFSEEGIFPGRGNLLSLSGAKGTFPILLRRSPLSSL